ncbi:MAG TPA: hypothetical protein VIL55_02805 [Naasia sp.]
MSTDAATPPPAAPDPDREPGVSLEKGAAEAGAARRPVELVTGARKRSTGTPLVPVLPTWLTTREDFTHTVRAWVTRHAHRAATWATAAPVLLLVLVGYAPRGLARVTAAWARYLYDYDSATLRGSHARGGDAGGYAQVQAARRASVKARAMVAGTVALLVAVPVLAWTLPRVLAGIVGVAVAVWIVKLIPGRGIGEVLAGAGVGWAVWWFGPDLLALVPRPPAWTWVIAGTAGVLALGWVGRPQERALVAREEVAGPSAVPLRAPLVRQALCDIGIGRLKDPDDIRMLTDVHRHGPGVQVDVELPAGVPASDVMEKREELAAALRRELGTVWPAVGIRHPGHLSLFVADQPMSSSKQAPWPLLREGTVNVFRGAPMVTDQRNQWIDVTLAYTAWVVGAVPRMGKTFFVREWLLVAGLDIRTRVYAFDLKGTGDLSPCAAYAHGYGVGDEPEDIEAQLQHLRDIVAEMRRRAKVIRELPRELAAENKVTDDLANRRDLRLEPIVLGVDECQVWFEHPDKAVRDEFIALCTDLVKRGPALGIIPLFATQKPDAKSIPTAISANASARFCLKVNGQPANDQVLGTSMYKEGVRATLFSFRDKGIAYLISDGAEPRIVRSVAGLDAVASEKVANRARALREAAGRLTGQAAGQVDEPEEPVVDVLDDVREVLDAEPARRMGLAAVRDRLALLRPAHYERWDDATLSAALRGAGVESAPVHCPVAGRTVRGVRREDLDGTPRAA